MILSNAYRNIILFMIACAVLFLAFNPLEKSQFGRTSDEGYYFVYATLVVHKGLPAFNDLISWYSSSDEARKHPSPVRVGYILLSAFLFKLCGHSSFTVLGFISTVSFFLFLYLCFYYVRKYFDLDTALLTTLLLASSPLILGLSRRALVDSPANFIWGAAVWLFLDVLLKPSRFSYLCFLIALVIAITFKEASVILIPFFVMAGIWGRSKGSSIKIIEIAGIIVCPAVLLLLIYLWTFGGIEPLKVAILALFKTHFSSHHVNPYAIDYSSGPWFRYLLDFLLLNPIVMLLFVGYVGYLCIQRTALDFIKTYLLIYFVYVYGVLSSLPHSKVVRFVENLEMVMALFAVFMLIDIFKGVEDKKRQRWLLFIAMVIFFYNWSSFMKIFYVEALLDPISYHLLRIRQFIPG